MRSQEIGAERAADDYASGAILISGLSMMVGLCALAVLLMRSRPVEFTSTSSGKR